MEAECRDAHPNESIQEGPWKTLPTTALLHWILRAEQPETGGTLDDRVQLRDENLASMIQERIQTLQNTLSRQVELIQKHPRPRLHGLEQRSVRPDKLASFPFRGGQVGPEEVHHIRLIAEVDANECLANSLTHGLDQGRLTDSWATFQQDRPGQLHRPQQPVKVVMGRLRLKIVRVIYHAFY